MRESRSSGSERGGSAIDVRRRRRGTAVLWAAKQTKSAPATESAPSTRLRVAGLRPATHLRREGSFLTHRAYGVASANVHPGS